MFDIGPKGATCGVKKYRTKNRTLWDSAGGQVANVVMTIGAVMWIARSNTFSLMTVAQ